MGQRVEERMASLEIIKGQDVRSGTRDRARDLRKRMTPAEERLWQALRSGQLEGLKFRRQQVIGGYIADFYCDSLGLVIEVDGPIHETQIIDDQSREEAIRLHGLRVVRFSNDQVLDYLPDVLVTIAKIVGAKGEHDD